MELLDKVPHLVTAFCGNTIRNGSLFIGWSSTISVGIMWSIYMVLLPSMFAHDSDKLLPCSQISKSWGDDESALRNSIIGMTRSEWNEEISKIFIIRVLTSSLGLILTYYFLVKCLLLYGVLKKKCYFILPWLLETSLSIVLELISSLLLFIFGAFFSQAPLLLILIPQNIICGLSIYFFLVITSYYKDIREEEITKTHANQPESTVELA